MNNNENKKYIFPNNIPRLKCYYLIKTNYPISQLFFIILYIFKYIGIIANTRIIEMANNKKSISLNKYLRNLFIFGKNFSVAFQNYQTVSISIAIFLLIFLLYMFCCIVYIRIKYKKNNSLIKEKMNNTTEKTEKFLFIIISYFHIAIVFFHQYLLEYYSFGIYLFIYYQFGIFSKKKAINDIYKNTLPDDFSEYFSNNNLVLIFCINIIVIIFVLVALYSFLIFNITKGLFITYGLYFGNMKYLICKMIIISLQPLFGINNFYSDKGKIILGLIFNAVVSILCLINFWSCFHQFGYYPNKIGNIVLFLEFFVFFSTLSEILLYFTGIGPDSSIFFFVKFFLQLINSYFLMRLFLYFKDNYYLNIFAKNLFSKNFINISKGGLYYYMQIYLDYQQDKEKNYLKLFRMLMTHFKFCKNIDCPGHKLVPIDYLKSSFVPPTIKDKKKTIDNNLHTIKEKNQEKKIENNKECEDSDKEDFLIDNCKSYKYCKIEDDNSKTIYNNESIFDENKKLSDKQFQIIFEQEIMNKIEFLSKTKKINILEDFIFIHLQYLYKMKKNYSLMLYYIGKYSKCGIKWSLIGQYFLYEYKMLIISTFFNKTNINNVDENTNKYRKDNHFMEDVINYFIFSAILRNLIIYSCTKLKILFNFRKELHIPIVLKTYKYSKTKKFFEIGEGLKNNIDKILYFLRYHIHEMSQQIISPELSYIISNFFIFIENKIPNDLIKVINPIFDVNIIARKLETGYKFLNLIQPLILTLTEKNTFKINYFSSVICNKLGFFQHELKEEDFHDKLFPGVQFIKQHELLMKQFLFFDNNSYIKKDTFLKDKYGYLIGINLTAKKFPTFYDDFFMIIGIGFNDNLFFSEVNKSYNRYSFLLNENLDFISETKNFYEDFEFNICMFKEIKTNFFEFFCIDKNKFFEKLQKKNSSLLKKIGINNIINLKKEEDAFTLFKTITYEKAYNLRDISKLETMKKDYIIIRDTISKDKIIRKIPEFNKLIEEYGLDCEWYDHLDNLNERLSIKEIKREESFLDYSKNLVSLDLNHTGKKSLKNTIITNNSIKTKEIKNENINSNNNNLNESLGGKSISSLSLKSKRYKRNTYEENNSKKLLENSETQIFKIILDRHFDFVYNLKKIGSIHFYIVDIYEKALYKKDYSNSFIYDSKLKYSFRKIIKEESDKLKEESDKLKEYSDKLKEEEKIIKNNKFIKSKTLFTEKKKNIKKFVNFDLSRNIVAEEKKENKNEIKKEKRWSSETNIIDMRQHLIKEGERMFNNRDILLTDIIKIDKNMENSRNNRINLSLKKNKKTNFVERESNRGGTKKGKLKNNNNIYNQKNQDFEEKITFLTKDNLDEYIKKSYITNRCYIIILFILFILTIISFAIKFVFEKTNYTFVSNLTNSMIYFEEIKTDINIGSILVLSQCYRRKQNMPIGLASFQLELRLKSNDLMNQFNYLENQLKLYQSNYLFSNIMNLIYENMNITTLNSDWTSKKEESYILKEINYFSYLLNIESSEEIENIKCNFDQNFYILFIKQSKKIYELNNKEETTFYQKFLYYVIFNVFNKINPKLNDIIKEITEIQINTMETYLIRNIIICSSIVAIIAIEEIIILFKIHLDRNFIREIIIYLYHYNESNLKYEYEINYLEITAKEFNLNNLNILENIKKENDYYLNLINSKKSKDFLLNNNDKNSNRESFKRTIKNNKTNLLENNNKNQRIEEKPDKNNMNGSLFNASMNNSSMLQFLNQKNNNDEIKRLNNNKKENKFNIKINKKKKKIKEELNKIEEIIDDKIYKESEETLELLKSNKKIIPQTIVISFFISILFSLIFISILFLNILDINSKRFLWEYSINLSVNYLERIPKLVELVLSTLLSVILDYTSQNKYNAINTYQKSKTQYMTYFTKFKNYDKSELISSNIKESIFFNEIYDNYRIKKNLEYCKSDPYIKNYFKNTKIWSKKLNEKNNFCINAAIKGVNFFNHLIDTLDLYFEYAEQQALSCYQENEKMNESGLDLEIDFILQELTHLYMDFEERQSNITFARQKFFESDNLIRILTDMNLPFTFTSGALFLAVNEDLNQLIQIFINYELILIIICYVVDALFLSFIIIMIIFNEKNKNILVFIKQILNKE